MAFSCRAKSCLGCRSAKRRCDRKSPVCSQCHHFGRECLYQQRPKIKFVGQTSRRTKKAATDTEDNLNRAGPVTAFSPSLTNTALEEQLRQIFWTTFFPKEDAPSALGTTFQVGPGLAQLQQTAKYQVSTRHALDACALTIFGRQSNDKAMQQRGMQSYGRAISQLQRAVARANHDSVPGLILSCRLLTLYEMMRPGEANISSQALDWKAHIHASCSMMESAGGSRYLQGANRALSRDVNRLAFRINFTSRQQECPVGDKWKDAPYSDPSIDLRTRLDAAMAALPPLLQQSNKVMQLLRRASGSNQRLALQIAFPALVDLLVDLARGLREWESDVLMVHMSETASSPTSTYSNCSDEAETLFEISQSHGYGFLLACNEYWTCQLVIGCQAQYLITYYDLSLGVELPALPDWMQDPDRLISNIARSASSLVSPSAGLWGTEQSVFPIGSCMHTLAGLGGVNSPEMAMLKAAIRNAKDAAFTTDFLKSRAFYSSPDDAKGDMDLPEDARRMGSRWYG